MLPELYLTNMIQVLSKISEEALLLSASDRAALAHVLIQSLDNERDEGIQEVYRDEIMSRKTKFEAGETSDRPAMKILDEIESKFS